METQMSEIAISMMPYIKRIRNENKTFHELNPSDNGEYLLLNGVKRASNPQPETVDIVMLQVTDTTTVDDFLSAFKFVKSKGIFCGDKHDKVETKTLLREFRRKNKIGSPINIVGDTIWFWYKE